MKKYKIFLGARNNKQNFAASKKTGCEVIPLDVTNINSIRDAINFSEPNIIIHAAATKFVDLSEKYPFIVSRSSILLTTDLLDSDRLYNLFSVKSNRKNQFLETILIMIRIAPIMAIYIRNVFLF